MMDSSNSEKSWSPPVPSNPEHQSPVEIPEGLASHQAAANQVNQRGDLTEAEGLHSFGTTHFLILNVQQPAQGSAGATTISSNRGEPPTTQIDPIAPRSNRRGTSCAPPPSCDRRVSGRKGPRTPSRGGIQKPAGWHARRGSSFSSRSMIYEALGRCCGCSRLLTFGGRTPECPTEGCDHQMCHRCMRLSGGFDLDYEAGPEEKRKGRRDGDGGAGGAGAVSAGAAAAGDGVRLNY